MDRTQNQHFIVAMIPMLSFLGLMVSMSHVRAQELPPVAPEAKSVPRGIKGAKFGMKPKELKRKLTYLGDMRETDPERVSYKTKTVDFPGRQLEADTTIGPLPAHCVFLFTRSNGLVGIECVLSNHGIDKKKLIFYPARRAIQKVLESKYGKPGSKSRPFGCKDYGPISCGGLWRWEDDAASLEVSMQSTESGWSISIMNESPEYQRAFDRTRRRAKKLYQQEQDEQRRKEQKLRRNIRRYDQDL